jgi:hypothetical protein
MRWLPVEFALYEGSARVVYCLDQTGISNADGVWSKANVVAMFLVQLPLCFDVRLAIVVEEAPDVGEFGKEGTGYFLEWGLKVGKDVLGDENDSSEANCLDEKSHHSHCDTLGWCSEHQDDIQRCNQDVPRCWNLKREMKNHVSRSCLDLAGIL